MQPPQTRIDLDILKQQYSQQQQNFERELEQLRFQMSRADVTRLQAERDLLLLQEKAREQKIWSILDQQASFPVVVEGTRMFRTAKYAIGNMSESEKRQQLLLDYYRKANQQIQPLYQTAAQAKAQADPQLKSHTNLILPKPKTQPQKFDESLLNDLESMRQRDQEITKRLLQDESEIVKDPEQFQKMLENQSLVQIMQEMKNQGQRPAVTPPNQAQITEVDLRKTKSEGATAEAFFLDTKNDQAIMEEDEGLQGEEEEDLMLNESAIPKITEQPYEFEEQEESLEEPEDPLEQNINDLLDHIEKLVQGKKVEPDYVQMKQKLRVATSKDYVLADKQRRGNYKKISFAKEEPIYVQRKEPIPLVVREDQGLNKLDQLIQDLAQ